MTKKKTPWHEKRDPWAEGPEKPKPAKVDPHKMESSPRARVSKDTHRQIRQGIHNVWWGSLDPFFQKMFMTQMDESPLKGTETMARAFEHWKTQETKKKGMCRIYTPGDPVPSVVPLSVVDKLDVAIVRKLRCEHKKAPKVPKKAPKPAPKGKRALVSFF